MKDLKKVNESVRPLNVEIHEIGVVESVRKLIVLASGVPSCVNGQIVDFENGSRGIVMGFKEDYVQILVISMGGEIRNGDKIYNRAEPLYLPVGEGFLGRIVSGICEPVDEKGPVRPDAHFPVFFEAPGIMDRSPVEKTLETGTMAIDGGIPIGLGQRQLLIGDRLTGKTTVAIDAILNQKHTGVICIYCCIGKPYASLLRVVQILNESGAMPYTIVVSGISPSPVAEQYLAPYTAAMLGEYFMQAGRDVLVVFDDLSKHAWVYRQISLLLERAPGREAYPGDIFYSHSQLVERAGYLKPELKGGSMTFLPIIEILQGDVTGYISTNLISMTDGQIYFNSSLFNKGIRPAVDFGLSVSRIGSKAQWPAMREVSKSLRIEYLHYQELLQMSQIRTSGLSKEAETRLKRGAALTAVLNQDRHVPQMVEGEIFILYALNRGLLDSLTADQIKKFKMEFFQFASAKAPALIQTLRKEKKLTQEIKAGIDQQLKDYFSQPQA